MAGRPLLVALGHAETAVRMIPTDCDRKCNEASIDRENVHWVGRGVRAARGRVRSGSSGVRSEDFRDLVEREARRALEESGRITVANIADEIRLHATVRKELLVH